MAVVFESIALTNTSSSSLTLTAPSGIASGDLLVALFCEDTGGTRISTFTGWTPVAGTGFGLSGAGDAGGAVPNGTAHVAQALYKIAGAGDVGATTYSATGSATYTGTQAILRFSGADTTTPVDIAAGQATASALTHATPSITPPTSGDLLLTHYAVDVAATQTWTQPTGTERADQTDPTAFMSIGAYTEQYNSVAAVSRTGTVTGSAVTGTALILALRAAAAPPPAGGAPLLPLLGVG